MEEEPIVVRLAGVLDLAYAHAIIHEMEYSAIARSSGIAKRSATCITETIHFSEAVGLLQRPIGAQRNLCLIWI